MEATPGVLTRTLLVLLAALAPAAADASCVSQTYQCLCVGAPSAGKGTIRSTDGGTSIASVDLVRTTLADAGIAQTVEVRAVAGDAPGLPLLLFFFSPQGDAGTAVIERRELASADALICSGVHFQLEEALQLAIDPSCAAKLSARLPKQECRGCGCSEGSPLTLLAVMLLLARRRSSRARTPGLT